MGFATTAALAPAAAAAAAAAALAARVLILALAGRLGTALVDARAAGAAALAVRRAGLLTAAAAVAELILLATTPVPAAADWLGARDAVPCHALPAAADAVVLSARRWNWRGAAGGTCCWCCSPNCLGALIGLAAAAAFVPWLALPASMPLAAAATLPPLAAPACFLALPLLRFVCQGVCCSAGSAAAMWAAAAVLAAALPAHATGSAAACFLQKLSLLCTKPGFGLLLPEAGAAGPDLWPLPLPLAAAPPAPDAGGASAAAAGACSGDGAATCSATRAAVCAAYLPNGASPGSGDGCSGSAAAAGVFAALPCCCMLLLCLA